MSKNIMKKLKSQLGFTMIELLIVITILGILAVAVLSAINPIEQINRGRDTGSQSDCEQLLGAVERFNAFQGHYPWQATADEPDTSVTEDDAAIDGADNTAIDNIPVAVSSATPVIDLNSDGGPLGEGDDTETNADVSGDRCPLLNRLGPSSIDYGTTMANCIGSDEIKQSFANRLDDTKTRTLFIYNHGNQGDSTYVCFVPQSAAFLKKAEERCANVNIAGSETVGLGMPADIEVSVKDTTVQAVEFICGNPSGTGIEEDGADFYSCLP